MFCSSIITPVYGASCIAPPADSGITTALFKKKTDESADVGSLLEEMEKARPKTLDYVLDVELKTYTDDQGRYRAHWSCDPRTPEQYLIANRMGFSSVVRPVMLLNAFREIESFTMVQHDIVYSKNKEPKEVSIITVKLNKKISIGGIKRDTIKLAITDPASKDPLRTALEKRDHAGIKKVLFSKKAEIMDQEMQFSGNGKGDMDNPDFDKCSYAFMEMLEQCSEKGRIRMKYTPQRMRDVFLIGHALGFQQTVTGKDLANAVRLGEYKKTIKSKVGGTRRRISMPGTKYDIQVMEHYITLARDVTVGGTKKRELIVVTNDIEINTKFSDALRENNMSYVLGRIESGEAEIVGFPMMFNNDDHLKSLEGAIGEKEGRISERMISEEKHILLSKTAHIYSLFLDVIREVQEYYDRTDREEARTPDKWIQIFRKDLTFAEDLQKKIEGTKNIENYLDTDAKKKLLNRQRKHMTRMIKTSLKNMALDLAMLYNEKKEYKEVIALIEKYCGDRTNNPDAQQLIKNALKHVEEEDIQTRTAEIRKLIYEKGLWDDAWNKAVKLCEKYSNRIELKELKDEVVKAVRATHPHVDWRIPSWLPPEDRERFYKLATALFLKRSEFYEFSNKPNPTFNEGRIAAMQYNMAYRELSEALLDLPDDVWEWINNASIPIRIYSKGNKGIDLPHWPETKGAYETLLRNAQCTTVPSRTKEAAPSVLPASGFTAERMSTGDKNTQPGNMRNKESLPAGTVRNLTKSSPQRLRDMLQKRGVRILLQSDVVERAAKLRVGTEFSRAIVYTLAAGLDTYYDLREEKRKETEDYYSGRWKKYGNAGNQTADERLFGNLKNLAEQCSLDTDVDKMVETMREGYAGFLNSDDQTVLPPPHPRGGWWTFPSLYFIQTIMRYGYRPVYSSPKEVVSFLRESGNIYKKDVVTNYREETVIRIFISDQSICSLPDFPSPVIDIYPLDEGANKLKTVSREEAIKMLKNWDKTLNEIGSISREDASKKWIISGINYDLVDDEGITQFVDTAWKGKRREEKEAKVLEIKQRRSAVKRGEESELEYDLNTDAHARRLLYALDAQECAHDKLAGNLVMAEKEMIYLLEILNGEEYRDLQYELILEATRRNETIEPSLLLEKIRSGELDPQLYRSCMLMAGTIKYLSNKWMRAAGKEFGWLHAPWSVITGWDTEASSREDKKIEERIRALWREYIILTVGIMASLVNVKSNSHAITITFSPEGNILLPMALFLLPKIGYQPLIEQEEFIDLFRHPGACSSARVIPGLKKHAPLLVVGLNESEGWNLKGSLTSINEKGKKDNTICIQLFKDGGYTVEDAEAPYQTIAESINKGDMVPLIDAVENKTAIIAVEYILVDHERLKEAFTAGAGDNFASEVKKFLSKLKQFTKKQKSLKEFIPKFKEVKRRESALVSIKNFKKNGLIYPALRRIKKALKQKPDDDDLLNENQEILLAIKAEELADSTDIPDLQDIQTLTRNIETVFCPGNASVTDQDMGTATEHFPVMKDLWLQLKKTTVILQKKKDARERILVKAREAFETRDKEGKRDIPETMKHINEAIDHSGDLEDTQKLKVEINQYLLFTNLTAKLETVELAVSARNVDVEDLENEYKHFLKIEKEIDQITDQDYLKKIRETTRKLKTAIERKQRTRDKQIARARSQIPEEITKIHEQIDIINDLESIVKLKTRASKAEKNIKRVPSQVARQELQEAYQEVINAVDERENDILRASAKEVAYNLASLKAEIDAAETLEDLDTIRKKLDTCKQVSISIAHANEQQAPSQLYEEINSHYNTVREIKSRQVLRIKNIILKDIQRQNDQLQMRRKHINATIQNIDNQKNIIKEIPSRLAQKQLIKKLDKFKQELSILLGELEQQEIISQIDAAIQPMLRTLEYQNIYDRKGRILVKFDPERFNKPIQDQLNRLDRHFIVSDEYAEKIENELRQLVEKVHKAIETAKEKKAEVAQTMQELEEEVDRQLAQLEVLIDDLYNAEQLEALRTAIERVNISGLSRDRQTAKHEYKESLKAIINKLIAEKSHFSPSRAERQATRAN